MFNTNGGYSLADIAAATGTNNGNGNGMWGDGGWWIILLFLFAWGGWGNNGWGNGGGTGTQSEIAYGFDMNGIDNGIRNIQSSLCDGFYSVNNGMLNSTAQLQNSISSINTALCGVDSNIQKSFSDSTIAAMQNNAALLAQLNSMQAQDMACCCETDNLINRNFADINYKMAASDCETRRAITDAARDITDNQNAGTRAILEFLTQNKIADLQAENQALKFATSQQSQNAFLISQLAPKAIPAYLAPNPYTGQYAYGAYNSCYSLLNNNCCSNIV